MISSSLRVAAIVPAKNEAPTIRSVVDVLVASPYIHEVIVVSDGSEDATAEIAEEAGARVIRAEQSHGKGGALRLGVSETSAEILLFADADLYHFTEDHIERLLLPVLSGSRHMNMGLRDRGKIGVFFMRHLPLIGGERAMRREVFERVPSEYTNGFMIESALNFACQHMRVPYGSVLLPGLSLRRKIDKVGLRKGLVQYIGMFREVVAAIIIVRFAALFRRF